MSDWILTVGMEVHVELETETKMFCGCKNDPFHSEPNTNVCPVCYGLPGALPLLNRRAIEMTVQLGQALKGEIPAKTFWARKNYFYPDLPKGYQISQSNLPLVSNATLVIDGEPHRINRIHLEEDAGKLSHAADKTHSLVDYNRAGVPLMEIVTEPDFHSAESAKRFCQELQRILRTLKLSSADMEKGQMRCEANISVAKEGEPFGVKVEVKNINSFRSVERAIKYEYDRQAKAIEAGEALQQETRTWNEAEGKTVVMRSKETSADYRYFPEPDLPVVRLSDVASSEDVVLPDTQRAELVELGVAKDIAAQIVDKHLYTTLKELASKNSALVPEVAKLLIAVPAFAELPVDEKIELLQLRQDKGWTKETTASVISQAVSAKLPVAEVASAFTHDLDLEETIADVIAANPNAVSDYKSGKETAINFLVGQVMAKTQGKANFNTVREELKKAL